MKIKYLCVSSMLKENYPKETIDNLLNKILVVTLSAKNDYPDYANWFNEKQVSGIYDGTRDVIVALYGDEIIGVSSIKNDVDEKKICTLYIKDKYRKNKTGIFLVEKSIDILGTDKPLITMPISTLPEFKNIIKKYNWTLSDNIKDCYKENTDELVFNGYIENSKEHSPNNLSESLCKIYTRNKNINIIKVSFKLRLLNLKFIKTYFSYNKD